jgi:Ca2+-binding RTX toxin-like protein
MPPETEVVVLHAGSFGLDQIVASLHGRGRFDAIHILSHGDTAAIQLGSDWLRLDNLSAHAPALQALGASLADHGDLLVYGCNVAKGTAGQAFVHRLAALTRADLAASSTPVGSDALGGNWALDVQVGGITTRPLFDSQTVYGHVLAAPVLRAASVSTMFSLGVVTINDAAQANPYPATLAVAGIPANILDVNVSLNQLNHSYYADLDIVLVGPTGATVMLMSDAPGAGLMDLMIDDEAAATMFAGPVSGGTYQPTNASGPDPMPGLTEPYGSALSVFDGTSPNGNWLLYIVDDASGDVGTLGNWAVQLTVDIGITSQSYTENDPPMAYSGLWFVGDTDSTQLQGASVVISSGFQTGDVLGFTDQSGITHTWNAGTRTLTLSGTASLDTYATAMASVTFANTTDTPGSATRTLSWSVTDTSAATSAAFNTTVLVTPTNDTPAVSAALVDQGAAVFETFSYQIPAGSFTDADGDALTYSATGLPAWLSFNPATRTFSGTPGVGNVGFADVTVTAIDPSLASTSDVFRVTVSPGTDRVYIQGADLGGGVRTLTANTNFMASPATGYAWFRFDGAIVTQVATGPGATSINVGAGDNFALYTVAVSHAGGTIVSGFVDPQAATPPAGILQSTGNPGNDTLPAAPIRAQTFIGYHGLDTITGTNGADWIDGGPDVDSMVGGLGNDTYIAHDALDVIVETAGGGTDLVMSYVTITLPAEVENLTLVGANLLDGTGNSLANTLTGNGVANTMAGLAGNDSVNGGGGNDSVDGGVDNDTLNGGDGADTLLGGTGNDSLLGAAGSDSLDGGENNDTLDGGAAADVLLGGNGNDSLIGGGGNDTLTGGAGTDTLNGGAGNDTLVLDNTSIDVIQSFAVVDDTFRLSKSLFPALTQVANTTLIGAAFWSGTAAHDTDDRIIYNPTSGALWYDADGNGVGAAVQIATLTGLAGALTQADFMVVA